VPAILLLDYRFNESLSVPGIVVTESAQATPGTKLELVLADKSCGEIQNLAHGKAIYVNGAAEIRPGIREGQWMVCKVPESPPRDAHTVMLTKGHVLIEVVAFPEAGVSRQEILRLAESFVEAQ